VRRLCYACVCQCESMGAMTKASPTSTSSNPSLLLLVPAHMAPSWATAAMSTHSLSDARKKAAQCACKNLSWFEWVWRLCFLSRARSLHPRFQKQKRYALSNQPGFLYALLVAPLRVSESVEGAHRCCRPHISHPMCIKREDWGAFWQRLPRCVSCARCCTRRGQHIDLLLPCGLKSQPARTHPYKNSTTTWPGHPSTAHLVVRALAQLRQLLVRALKQRAEGGAQHDGDLLVCVCVCVFLAYLVYVCARKVRCTEQGMLHVSTRPHNPPHDHQAAL